MKILKYAPGNLEEIARVNVQSIEEVEATLAEANRVRLQIYSVVDFVHFGSLKKNDAVTYLSSEIINEHYRKTEPERAGHYTSVEVKYRR